MKTLVLGASGATGKHLVDQLLQQGIQVKAMLRNPDSFPKHLKKNKDLHIIQDSISQVSIDKMSDYLKDCDAVASCLGHNLNIKGIYGKPRKLVRDAIQLACQAIELNKNPKPIKVLLMNTSGNQNGDLKERRSFGEKTVIALIRLLLPPQTDNEKAADYLRLQIGKTHSNIEWVAIRPDGLIDAENVTKYIAFPSPVRSPIFNAGQTSRINVGNFMAKLVRDDELWNQWKGQMPVLYNEESVK